MVVVTDKTHQREARRHSAKVDFDLAKYRRLLAKAAPRLARTRAEFDHLVTGMETLDRKSSLTPEELELRRVLDFFIREFDDRIELPESGSPLQIVRHLMEHRGIRQADLLPVFGSRGVASDVLAGKREISKTHARGLAKFFGLPAGLFI